MNVLAFTNRRPWVVKEPLQTVGPEIAIVSGNELYKNRTIRIYSSIIRQGREKVKQKDPEVIIADSLGLLGIVAVLFSLWYRIPLILRLGGNPWSVRSERIKGILVENPFQLRVITLLGMTILDNIALLYSDGYIVVSESVKEDILQRINTSPDKVKVVHQPPNMKEITKTKSHNKNDKKTILTVTNLQYKSKFEGVCRIIKDIEDILQKNQDTEYIIAGDGPYYDYLTKFIQNEITDPGVKSRIKTPGFVSDIGTLYANSDIVVYISFIDGYPNVPLEAQAAGLPVIANAGHGIIEQIEDGETGILVDPTNQYELRKSIEYLLERPEERHYLGAKARQKIEQENDQAAVGEQLYEAIEEIYSDVSV